VTIVHKANILKALTGVFLETARDVGRRYEGRVKTEDRIVDACAMQLVLNPGSSTTATTNLFGDIRPMRSPDRSGPGNGARRISAMVSPFEAVHGSAPDIAGRGIANPLALILASAMMLSHVGRQDLAERLETAIDRTLNQDSVRTRDLGGSASTTEFADALIRRL
jgi:isocitrate dehydrogenase (NAD+)